MGWANFVAVLDFEIDLLLVEIVVVVDAVVGISQDGTNLIDVRDFDSTFVIGTNVWF